MLIEAAYSLPKWLKPETAANRIWIRAGHLHIIPQPSASNASLPAFPTLSDALGILRHPPCVTVAPPKVEAALMARLRGLPDSALASVQTASARLPLRLAAALLMDPQIISSVVEAFCYRSGGGGNETFIEMRCALTPLIACFLHECRDADDMRAIGRAVHFAVNEETITCPVQLSQCQHAQLMQQRFAAPRSQQQQQQVDSSADQRAADLGRKLTAGFEVLYSRAARLGRLPPSHQQHSTSSEGRDVCAGSESVTLKSVQRLPAWLAYKASLERNGYFEGNIEGAARHKELLYGALAEFCSGPLLPRSVELVADPVIRAAQAIDAARSEAGGDITAEWVRSRASAIPSSPHSAEDDPEAEMERQARRVDAELARRQAELQSHAAGRRHADGADDKDDSKAREQVVEAAELVHRLSTFVASLSGPEVCLCWVGDSAVGSGGSLFIHLLRR